MDRRHTRTDRKVELGQFYTTFNPFVGAAFDEWIKSVPTRTFLEPFAGAGNLFDFIDGDWIGFDIEPNDSRITQRDTLSDFPKGYDVTITNPPYLAKNVITRKGLPVKVSESDLYLDCLKQCLDNCKYVAAIIPATFLNQTKFHDRLSHIDKIDRKLFDSTDEPACVAYFMPEQSQTKFYVDGVEIKQSKLPPGKASITFNSDNPNYTLIAIDSVKGNSIRIQPYNGEVIKHTNRHIVPFKSDPLDLDQLNQLINDWRNDTKDLFLTPFKSCKRDGSYRKRIPFNVLNSIITKHHVTPR